MFWKIVIISICMGASLAFPFVMHGAGIPAIVTYLFIVSIGFSLFYPANNKFCILSVPESRRSMSVGIFLTVWVGGMSLGVSFFELFFSGSLLKLAGGLSALNEVIRNIPHETISNAFRNVYFAGFVIISIALAFLLVSQIRIGKDGTEKE
jgi:hypothetical protein